MTTLETKFDYGDELEDEITGYKGIVVVITKWKTGCIRYGLKSQNLKEGIPQDSQWFDEPELKLVKTNPEIVETKDVGGPNPTPPRFDNR